MVKQHISIAFYKTPYGELLIGTYADALCLCDWRYRKQRTTVDNRIKSGLQAEFKEENHPIFEQAKTQLAAYFSGNRETFDVPLLVVGTDFQKQVWEALGKIPFGETRSYLQLSKTLGNEKAIRAIASANGANALSIFIPCHRIIGADGSLTGYAGGLNAKKKLLELEGIGGQMELF